MTSPTPASAGGPSSNAATLPQRGYGRNGLKLSVIGFGGIAVMNTEQSHADRMVAAAVERGVNYFDVAPSYGDAEVQLGPALKPYRKNVFLACKSNKRTREQAAEQMDASLERLKTDYFDLYQLHGLTDVAKDVDVAFAKGGVMELVREAKKAGRIRHVGFSAHTTEAALAALARYEFDSVLFPVNFACWLKGGFGQEILEAAKNSGASRLALKGLARQRWPENDPSRQAYAKCWYQPMTDPREAQLALRWTLSQDITAAVTPGEESLLKMALEIAGNFKPITAAEEQQLRDLAAPLNPIFSH